MKQAMDITFKEALNSLVFFTGINPPGLGLTHPVRGPGVRWQLFYQLLFYGNVWISAFLVSTRGTKVGFGSWWFDSIIGFICNHKRFMIIIEINTYMLSFVRFLFCSIFFLEILWFCVGIIRIYPNIINQE